MDSSFLVDFRIIDLEICASSKRFSHQSDFSSLSCHEDYSFSERRVMLFGKNESSWVQSWVSRIVIEVIEVCGTFEENYYWSRSINLLNSLDSFVIMLLFLNLEEIVNFLLIQSKRRRNEIVVCHTILFLKNYLFEIWHWVKRSSDSNDVSAHLGKNSIREFCYN